jgi:hydroxyacylglutathione hydrolase
MFDVLPVRAFRDNYIWTLRRGESVAVVDPGDAQPVLEYLARERVRLVAILATHHHADHVGGIATLCAGHDVPVYGPRHEPIPTLTRPVGGGDTVTIPELDASFAVLDIPGHTRAHVAYYGAQSLFCGDTLFACGCGRVFEGTPEQMSASLARLAALPDDTRVYCGHEYTLANIAFARTVEPANAALATLEVEAREQRAQDRPTLPSTVGREKATNPFLRCTEAAVIRSAEAYLGARTTSPVGVFAALREWKNRS